MNGPEMLNSPKKFWKKIDEIKTVDAFKDFIVFMLNSEELTYREVFIVLGKMEFHLIDRHNDCRFEDVLMESMDKFAGERGFSFEQLLTFEKEVDM